MKQRALVLLVLILALAFVIPASGQEIKLYSRTVTIANGESLSGSTDLTGYSLVAIQMPAAWTAASITFAGSSTNGGTYGKLRDYAGTEYTITSPLVTEYIPLGTYLPDLAGVRFLKVRSGTAASAVAQGAARVITLIVRKI